MDIGSVLYYSSQIAYTFENYVQVRVGAKALDTNGDMHETNVFHYTFRLPEKVKRGHTKDLSRFNDLFEREKTFR